MNFTQLELRVLPALLKCCLHRATWETTGFSFFHCPIQVLHLMTTCMLAYKVLLYSHHLQDPLNMLQHSPFSRSNCTLYHWSSNGKRVFTINLQTKILKFRDLLPNILMVISNKSGKVFQSWIWKKATFCGLIGHTAKDHRAISLLPYQGLR